MQIAIHYDGDCPFCARYVRWLRLRETVGDVRLVDLRVDHAARERLRAQGHDLDQGMVVEIDGQAHAGAEAVHRLALLSTPSDRFNRLNRWVLGHHGASAWVYPWLRAGRNATLFLLGREALAMREAGAAALFTVFAWCWAAYALLHVMVYRYHYGVPMFATGWAVVVAGLALLVVPASRRLFVLLAIALALDAWQHMPIYSNHTMLQNVVLAAMGAAGLWQWWCGGRWETFFADVAVVGRCALLTMYFFGVFHKVNTDFLNPQVSCALVLWREMPAWLAWLDFPGLGPLLAWGTLAVETAIACMLLRARWRHAGIVLGMGFHMLLGLSGYAMYAAFSMLAVALHALFLTPAAAQRVLASPPWQAVRGAWGQGRGRILALAWMAANVYLAEIAHYASQWMVFLLVLGPLWWGVVRHGRDDAGARPIGAAAGVHLLWTPRLAINLLSLAIFLNGWMPYLGLKTAQSINMFANLRLEGGVSNHLLLPHAPGPFRYLDDVVTIEQASGSRHLMYLQREQLGAVYYSLLDALERAPGARVTYVRHGVRHENQTAATLAADIEATLHPRGLRRWFHFVPVDLRQPKPCALDR